MGIEHELTVKFYCNTVEFNIVKIDLSSIELVQRITAFYNIYFKIVYINFEALKKIKKSIKNII